MTQLRKLTDAAVEEIKASTETAEILAQRYGVSKSTIHQTRRGARNQNRDAPVKLGRPRLPRPLCSCGCGEHVKDLRARYLKGHASRAPDAKWRTNPCFVGSTISPETDEEFLQTSFDRCEHVERGHGTACWLYTGGTSSSGYALTMRGLVASSTTRHRAIYALLHPDADLKGKHVDHLCAQGENDITARRCLNPAHLALTDPASHLQRHRSQLTWEDVRAIRARHTAGEKTATLAAEYGYSAPSMQNIVSGHRWKEAS